MADKRLHNVFFNTHTVSGIVISVGLYIIFFAGSFSFFKDEIHLWQNGRFVNHDAPENIDYDNFLHGLDSIYDLQGRDLSLILYPDRNYITVNLGVSKDTTASEKAQLGNYFRINLHDLKAKSYTEGYDLGEFLYRLHFLDPIPYPYGRNLAGIIALFFLFAIITGVIVHWKKAVPHFYKFDPKASLKRVWTDAHTVLGFIGLPFQFIYAATGSFMIISAVAFIPANYIAKKDGNIESVLYKSEVNYPWEGMSEKTPIGINKFIEKTRNKWNDSKFLTISVYNHDGTNMAYSVSARPTPKDRFVGSGRVDYDAYSGEINYEKAPKSFSYIADMEMTFDRLHFGDYGGLKGKIIYFLLGLISCFVILSGVLIWVESRNKKTMTLGQRRYTVGVGYIYLAICLSMLPVTALTFSFVRITNGMLPVGQTAIYRFYFITWLVFTIFYTLKRDNYFVNKNSLLLGGIFGLLVPIVNGITSRQWIWITMTNGQKEILIVDLLWIVLSIVSLLTYFSIKPSIKERSTFAKYPVKSSKL